jgi:hypothetical protein
MISLRLGMVERIEVLCTYLLAKEPDLVRVPAEVQELDARDIQNETIHVVWKTDNSWRFNAWVTQLLWEGDMNLNEMSAYHISSKSVTTVVRRDFPTVRDPIACQSASIFTGECDRKNSRMSITSVVNRDSVKIWCSKIGKSIAAWIRDGSTDS